MPRTFRGTRPRFLFLYRFANRVPVFFSWDHIYSKKQGTGRKALWVVSCDSEVLNAGKGGWNACMVE